MPTRLQDVIYVLPPLFKGCNEEMLARKLFENIKNPSYTIPFNPDIKNKRSGNFYDIDVWMENQANVVKDYLALISKINFKDGTEINIVSVDFWCPGIEQIYLINKFSGINAKYIGWLHGASWVDGDLMSDRVFGNDIPFMMERAWLEIYDTIWYTSDFFVYGFPVLYKRKSQRFSEFFDANKYLKWYKNFDDKVYDVIYTGRLTPDRNPNFLLDVCEALVGRGLKVLILAPSLQEVEESVIKRLDKASVEGLSSRFLDVINGTFEEDMYMKFLQNSKVVLSTAYQEGWGYGILKAVCAGCIPALPNSAVYPELYPGKYLFKQNDVNDAVLLIERNLRNKDVISKEDIAFLYNFDQKGEIKNGIFIENS